MSYINDALKKAQRERDGRYERFGGIIAAGAERQAPPRKKRLAVGAAVVLPALVAAGLALYIVQPFPLKQEISRPAAADKDSAVQPASPPAAEQAAPTAASQGGSKTGQPAPDGAGAPSPLPQGAKPVLKASEARYQEALSAQRKGDFGRAKKLYQEALTLDPAHVKALNNLGVIYMGQKLRGKAMAAFSRAVVLQKDYVDPYYNLACLYAQTNEIDESLWYLKVAVSINGDVKKWAGRDADLKNVVASPAFKKMMEGREN